MWDEAGETRAQVSARDPKGENGIACSKQNLDFRIQ